MSKPLSLLSQADNTEGRYSLSLTDADFAYAAGLLDGEGYIAAVAHRSKSRGRTVSTKGKPYIHCDSRITITMTSKEPVEWFFHKFGGTLYFREMRKRWKNQWIWLAMDNRKKKILLEGVLPYLKVKKQQAILVLEYVNMDGQSNVERRIEIARLCKELNKKGKPVTTNTPDCLENGQKIESELIGDNERALGVIQGTAA